MFEKTPENYDTFPDAIFWKDDAGEFHRKHGPAVMYGTGQWVWYKHGEIIKRVNTEDDDVQIKEIIKEIDFGKIHTVMTFLDWRWGFHNAHVPSVEELIEEAERLLNGVKKYRDYEEPGYCMCGGFKATACKSGFSLEFILESWETS